MTVDEYLKAGEILEAKAFHITDGCTLVGWIVHKFWPEAKKACWAHDFGRRGTIPFSSQYENDKLFKDALKYVGVPRVPRTLMYWAVRIQGFTKLDPVLLFALFMFGLLILLITQG